MDESFKKELMEIEKEIEMVHATEGMWNDQRGLIVYRIGSYIWKTSLGKIVGNSEELSIGIVYLTNGGLTVF